jgi:hypothetical protein
MIFVPRVADIPAPRASLERIEAHFADVVCS